MNLNIVWFHSDAFLQDEIRTKWLFRCDQRQTIIKPTWEMFEWKTKRLFVGLEKNHRENVSSRLNLHQQWDEKLVFEKEKWQWARVYDRQLDEFVLCVVHEQVANQERLRSISNFDSTLTTTKFLRRDSQVRTTSWHKKKKTISNRLFPFEFAYWAFVRRSERSTFVNGGK